MFVKFISLECNCKQDRIKDFNYNTDVHNEGKNSFVAFEGFADFIDDLLLY